jgi:pimeloyl-ACP methyl ester carboxylesterase
VLGLAGALAVAGCTRGAPASGQPAQPAAGRGETITVDGVPLYCERLGLGPPVVLIHGASGNLRDWTFRIAPRLAEHYRVIAFDRPGFGYSDRLPRRGWAPGAQAAHLRAAASRIGSQRPVVVGHSWGGALAMAWGTLYPDEVRGVVTIAGATMPWGGDIPFLYELGASPLGPIVGGVVSLLASDSRVVPMIERVFAPQQIPDGYLDHFGWPLSTRPRSFRWNARDLARLNDELVEQSRHYPSMQIPVEILHGTADTTVSPQIHSRAMHELLPSSRLTLIEGLGHMPHHFAGETLEAAIARLAGA